MENISVAVLINPKCVEHITGVNDVMNYGKKPLVIT